MLVFIEDWGKVSYDKKDCATQESFSNWFTKPRI